MRNKIGIVLAGMYLLIALYFITTQGLFGESFIALILGMPWTAALSAFEFGQAEGFTLGILLVLPIALNAYILYWIGGRIGRTIKTTETD